jgi:hypothetical protein
MTVVERLQHFKNGTGPYANPRPPKLAEHRPEPELEPLPALVLEVLAPAPPVLALPAPEVRQVELSPPFAETFEAARRRVALERIDAAIERAKKGKCST